MPLIISGAGSSGAATRLYDVVLIGVINGINRTFTTPDTFVQNSIVVFHNGRRMVRSATTDPRGGEYFVSESGGPGTGFNTIDFLTFAPNGSSHMVADYDLP